MGLIEAFLGAATAGIGILLAVVAALAARRSADRKMAVLAVAFTVAAAGGVVLAADDLLGGPLGQSRDVMMGAALLGTLLLLYGALFMKRA